MKWVSAKDILVAMGFPPKVTERYHHNVQSYLAGYQSFPTKVSFHNPSILLFPDTPGVLDVVKAFMKTIYLP